jgi:hypothetical protein
MKRKFLFVISITVISILILRTSIFEEADNYYNYITGHIYCQSKPTCLHEAAHKHDDESKMISESAEWLQAVDDYRMTQFYTPQENKVAQAFGIMFFPGVGSPRLPEYNIFARTFWHGGWGGYTELYAHLIECSDGDINNIPPALRDFYDMNEITKTMKGLGY